MIDPSPDQDLIREVLERVSRALHLTATIVVDEHEGQLTGRLEGDHLGLFIGHHGQTIDAVQHLVQRMVHVRSGALQHIVIDAEGYRERRRAALELRAEEAAVKAIDLARPVNLDPMTAGERRLIHEYLRERGGVGTQSEGDEPDRYVVIVPEKT